MTRMAVVGLLCVWGVSLQAQGVLDRRVILPAREVSLGAALDTIAARADIRLSYSAEAVPTARRVTIRAGASTVADALARVLGDLPIAPMAIGHDHVALIPRDPRPSAGATLLERIDVTEDRAPSPGSSPTVAREVITGAELERRHVTTLAQALSGSVPGVWLWEQAPTALMSHYGSLRGTASFGVSYPKVYVDGIEVANPMFFSQIAPEMIDRIEIIRGPHGAAQYGADAVTGVVNITSRQRGFTGPTSVIQSDLGVIQSAFGSVAPTQRHAMSVRGGSTEQSGGLSLGAATSGNYLPNAYTRELQAAGDWSVIGRATTVLVSARVHGKEAGVPFNPLLPDSMPPVFERDQGKQGLGMYSMGSTVRRVSSPDVAYTFTLGVDGYRLGYVHLETTRLPTSADSALRSASGGADRLMLRGLSEQRLSLGRGVEGRLTFGAEQALLRDHSLSEAGSDSVATVTRRVDWTVNAGVLARGDLAIGNRVFVSAGSRLERIQTERRPRVVAFLPQLGLAVRQGLPGMEVTARGSYGRGIRSPSAGARAALWQMPGTPSFTPEQQSGFEGGVDVVVLRRLSMRLTHFDQTATGLQDVSPAPQCVLTCAPIEVDDLPHSVVVSNGGSIRNTGWEAEGALQLDHLVLSAASSLTNSRIERLSADYAGELRVGDRMLGVPRRTRSATVEWVASRWSTSWSIARASDWVNYDRLRIVDLVNTAGTPAIIGAIDLRDFWMTYPGATRARGTVQVRLPEDMTLILTGDNLTNTQRGEPDSMTILPGRTFTLGLRARF